MKKILIFSLAYYPHVGGAEVAIKEITDRISDIEWHMVTLRFSAADLAEEKIGTVVVHRVGSGSGYLSKIFFILSAARKAKNLHAQYKFDAVWAMMSYMTLPIVLARLGIPYALTLQEGDTYKHMFERLRIVPFLPMLKKGFRGAKIVTALSHFLAAWAKQMGYQGAVVIVPNGADVKKFTGPKVPHERIALVTSSRLVHKNAVDDIIRALAQLPNYVQLVVAGSGPSEVVLKALAQELKVSDRVKWLGYVGHDQLPSVLHAADIFVRPSRSEGFGASFAEAMAAHLPIVATQEGGIADFLFDAVRNPGVEPTGFAVDKDAPDQIAKQVMNIVDHPAEAERVAKNARHMVEQKYDWDVIARSMREQVFSAVL